MIQLSLALSKWNAVCATNLAEPIDFKGCLWADASLRSSVDKICEANLVSTIDGATQLIATLGASSAAKLMVNI